MLGKLGKRCAFVGKVGEDMFGRRLKEVAQQAGICMDHLVFDPKVPSLDMHMVAQVLRAVAVIPVALGAVAELLVGKFRVRLTGCSWPWRWWEACWTATSLWP